MKIIDAHIHTSVRKNNFINPITPDLNKLNKDIKKNDIEFVISITSCIDELTPLEYDDIISLMKLNNKVKAVIGINPNKFNNKSLEKIEVGIKLNLIKGLKIYPGYYYFYPSDKVYDKFYKLAEKYDIPVIIHCGDTFKKNALVKYSHPLEIDNLAVKYPKVKFIIAHLGNPWTLDAAEVVYKNENVYTDLSGLALGNKITNMTKKRVLEALDYIEDYNKVIYGSDWPLVDLTSYIKEIKSIIPKRYYNKVFYENAKKLFKL